MPSRSRSRDTTPTAAAFGATWYFPLILIAAVTAAYSNSFHGEFIFDDIPSIHQNPTVVRPNQWSSAFWPGVDRGRTVDGRPLVNASLALNYALSGLDVRSYHAVNLFIHLAATLTLYGLARRTLLMPKLGQPLNVYATGLALAIALLWGLHPLGTNAVTYIVQRAEAMASLFYLLTLYAVARGETSTRPRAWRLMAIGACLAGMATKEIMVSAPVVALLYLWSFRFDTLRDVLRNRWPLLLGLASSWLLLGGLVLSHGGRGGSVDLQASLSPAEYAKIQVTAVVHYLKLCVVPRPLVLDYGKTWEATPLQTAVSGALLVAMAAATLWGLVRCRGIGFLGTAFFLILTPSSSVVPIITQVVAEHRMYLPLASVISVAVLCAFLVGRRLYGKLPPRLQDLSLIRAMPGLILLLLALSLGLQTWVRNLDYQTGLSIWTDTAFKRPQNHRAHSHLATFALQAGDYTHALDHFRRVLELTPQDANIYFLRGVVYLQLEDYRLAIADFDRCLEIRPSFAEAHQNRGVALLKMEKYSQAEQDFTRAMQLGPTLVNAYRYRALARAAQGRVPESQEDAREFLRRGGALDPELQRLLTGTPSE